MIFNPYFHCGGEGGGGGGGKIKPGVISFGKTWEPTTKVAGSEM